MAPGILPVATSFLKNSPTLASFSSLKCAPGGISKVPSAATIGTASSMSSAPTTGAHNQFLKFINPSPINAGSVAEGSVGARAAEGGEHFFVQLGAIAREAAEDNPTHCGRRGERVDCGRNGDAGCSVGGKAIDAGGNGGKGDRGEVVRLAKFDCASITGRKRRILALIAAVPYRPDGMDHVFRLQPI